MELSSTVHTRDRWKSSSTRLHVNKQCRLPGRSGQTVRAYLAKVRPTREVNLWKDLTTMSTRRHVFDSNRKQEVIRGLDSSRVGWLISISCGCQGVQSDRYGRIPVRGRGKKVRQCRYLSTHGCDRFRPLSLSKK